AVMLVEHLLNALRSKHLKFATAESCTGGMVSAALTDIPGSSDVFERGFVTYSNESKTEMLGVPAALIQKHGAVSEEVAKAMAEGALKHSRADVAVAITGVAGPGQSENKPAGLVHIAVARRGGKVVHQEYRFKGGRAKVRRQSVEKAFKLLMRVLA